MINPLTDSEIINSKSHSSVLLSAEVPQLSRLCFKTHHSLQLRVVQESGLLVFEFVGVHHFGSLECGNLVFDCGEHEGDQR